MMQMRNFSICDAKEDEITEKLVTIITELHVSNPEAVNGFGLFEKPTRGATSRADQVRG